MLKCVLLFCTFLLSNGALPSGTLDDLVAPFSKSISQDVAGNMTASLFVNHNGRKGRMSPLHPHRLMLTRIRRNFDKSVPTILKSHVLRFLV